MEPAVSRRLLVVLVALGVLATGGGVAGGLLLASDPGPATEAAGPTTIPETTAPVTSEPASSTSSTESSSTTSTTSGLDLQAQVVERAEDGVLVRYDASEPVAAVLNWGFGDPDQHRLQFPGPASQGTIKLALATTARAVSVQVTGRSADGRTGSSDTLTARRLVRRVVLEVRDLTLDIPDGTGGIITRFRGPSFTPLGPGLVGPTASSEPFAFPSSVLGAGASSSPLTLRLSHEAPPDPPRTRLVNLTIPFPRSGQTTLSRVVSGAGLTAHLRLRVTVTAS
jgi:hypothetical protein